MLDEHQECLTHRWISGDDELGRSSWFRHELRSRGESYLLAVPSNTLIRDRMVAAPEIQGRGRPRQVPFQRVDQWMANQEESSWTQLEVRAGEKGPIVVEALMCRVQTKREGRVSSGEETLVVFRERQGNGTWKHDYCLSNEGVEIGLSEYARVFKSQHRIEECLQRAKSEAGLGDYQVRSWEGWHHHQVLSLLATWFLTRETRREKNTDTRDHGSAVTGSAWWPVESSVAGESSGAASASGDASVATKRGSKSLPLASA
jgi:hypothetical protein